MQHTNTQAGERTQLSNPRTAQGRPLRCPECGAYAHAQDTKCKAELSARNSTPDPTTRPAGAPAQASEPQAASETISERIIQSWFAGRPNADLIALANAAPETKAQRDELLAACKLALEYPANTLYAIPPTVRATLNAAITKAEGKEQAQ